MKKILPLLFLIFILGCTSKIQSIIEYRKTEDRLIKNRVVKFDKDGNKILERNFGNARSNRIEKIQYENEKK